MKKLLLVAAFLGILSGSASATCTGPAIMHDFPGTAFNMSLGTNSGDGNCVSNIAITTWGGINLAAATAYGTAPTGIVPGVNAFVTNFPATQAISAASLPLPTGAMPSSGGSVTANLGTIAGVATAANQGTTADAPCPLPATTAVCGEIAIGKAIANAANGSIPAGTATIGTVGQLTYPVGATPITASATGTTAATTATLAGTTGKTTYICGYSIRANATAVTTVTDTITGVITATLSSILWVPANTAGLGVDEQIFSPCIPASATNTPINVVSGAPGTGGLVSSKGWGYQL